MKKTYQAPILSISLMETETLISISLSKYESGGGDQLVKGDGDWDIWGESSDEEATFE